MSSATSSSTSIPPTQVLAERWINAVVTKDAKGIADVIHPQIFFAALDNYSRDNITSRGKEGVLQIIKKQWERQPVAPELKYRREYFENFTEYSGKLSYELICICKESKNPMLIRGAHAFRFDLGVITSIRVGQKEDECDPKVLDAIASMEKTARVAASFWSKFMINPRGKEETEIELPLADFQNCSIQ